MKRQETSNDTRIPMKARLQKSPFRFGLMAGLYIFCSVRLLANVVITQPTGGQNISADKALTSTNGAAFTALGNIVIAEGASADFAAGAGQTLTLTPPDGWRFNPGVGSVTFQGSRDITSASVLVTASNLTVTVSVGGASKGDIVTVSGVQVQPLVGTDAPLAGYIRRNSANPGTATISGIVNDNTTFGLLNIVAGAARALALQTQPSATAIAGVQFEVQPEVMILDQFGNLRQLDTTTVTTAARATGSGTLQGSLKQTAIGGVTTYTNLSHAVAGTITIQFSATNLTSVTSDSILITPAPADRLVFATQPGAATAGAPFGVVPVLRAQDRFGSYSTVGLAASQPVTVALTAGTGALLGTTTLDIGTNAGNGVASFSDLQINLAGLNKQLTAGSPGLTGAVSSNFTVNAGAFTRLQLLVPGETAAPATANGKTGSPISQIANAPFNVTVNAVDTHWNLVSGVTHTVGFASSDAIATLPANASLVGGTKNFSVTLKSAGGSTLTASDITDGAKTPSSTPLITVNPGPASRLMVQTQPSSVATAGVAFPEQPAIRIEDAAGNLVAADNGRIVTASRAGGSGGLQGPLTATTVNGIATFANLSCTVAGSLTLNFSAAGLTGASSGAVNVGPGAFVKLQLLVPGETAAPGSVTGKTGTPLTQVGTTPFDVTVNAVDANWNLVNSVVDAVGIASSDAGAMIPANAALVSGTKLFRVALNTAGTATITASDVSDSNKATSTSPAISVVAPNFTAAAGGSAISADATSGGFTNLTGPAYSELASGNVGPGTIVLKAPGGFLFDTGGTAPTVLITRLAGSGKNANNINGVASGTAVPLTSVTPTQLVFTVTRASLSGVTCKLTWQNVRVRPAAGTPLAGGNLTAGGTATLATVSTNSNFGTLREVAGAARKLGLLTAPGATATAGAALAPQPVVEVQDQFGNRCTNNSSVVVTATRGAGSGSLLGATNATAAGGLATFVNLAHTVATNITINFTSGGLTGVSSGTIAVTPAAATQLNFATQPANGAVGAPLAVQPVLRTCDLFGNPSTNGLGSHLDVTLSMGPGTGPLTGTTTLDIGTEAGNGLVGFLTLGVNSAGTNLQLIASAGGMTDAVSSGFNVVKGNQAIAFGTLGLRIYGDSPFTLSASASSGLGVSFSLLSGPATVVNHSLNITGAGMVTVRATQAGDANWNAAPAVDQSFTVAKAQLTITAENISRTYGATNPPLTAAYSGFVNGDGAGVLSGSPQVTTTATPASPATSGGPGYPITVAQGTLIAGNYSFSFLPGSLTVEKATLTVTAENKSRPYGAANPPLTFACSGFVNGESESSVTGSPSLSTAAIAGSSVAGAPYPINVGPGTMSAPNYDYVFVDGSLTVTKATLTVTADDKSRVYGAPNPAFTADFSGFVNGENTSVLEGAPVFDTTGTAASPVAGGPYVINVSQGTLSSSNYDFSFVPGALSLTPATATMSVSSSSNPAPNGSNVVLTATLSAVSPSAAMLTGTVQFRADGNPLGSPVTLDAGGAVLATSELTPGAHFITAEFPSTGDFIGVTNSLGVNQVINSAPLAAPATYWRATNTALRISIPEFLANYTSDADGGVVTLVSISSGTNGATIKSIGNAIYYLPSDSDPNRNSTDHLEYIVTDGMAGSHATNSIRILLNDAEPRTVAANLLGLASTDTGIKVTFAGVPGFTYRVERAGAFESPGTVWQELGAASANDAGLGEFTDASAPSDKAFYRAVWP